MIEFVALLFLDVKNKTIFQIMGSILCFWTIVVIIAEARYFDVSVLHSLDNGGNGFHLRHVNKMGIVVNAQDSTDNVVD